MTDKFYRGTLTTGAVVSELAAFLEGQLQDSGDTYQLSDLLAHVAVGSFVDNGTITQTDDEYIVHINGTPYFADTILDALSAAITEHPISSIVNFVGSSLIDAIFGNNFVSDTRILDADGNRIDDFNFEEVRVFVKNHSNEMRGFQDNDAHKTDDQRLYDLVSETSKGDDWLC